MFTPYGTDEPLLRAAGFTEIVIEDVSANIEKVAAAWRTARERVSSRLDNIEGTDANQALQQFLTTVHTLAADRRLSRLAYHATNT